jgi:hypothetical protein
MTGSVLGRMAVGRALPLLARLGEAAIHGGVIVALSLAIAAGPASARSIGQDFAGPYSPARWMTALTGALPGGGLPAGVDASGAPSTVTVVGGDGVPPGGTDCWDDTLPSPRKGCAIFYTITASRAGTVRFDWAYESFDNSSSAKYDVFGYVVNGAKTQLTADEGPVVQSGSVSFTVLAGQTFGFWLDCGDCGYGNAQATVRGFSAPAAEPAPVPALGGPGLAALAGLLALLATMRLR